MVRQLTLRIGEGQGRLYWISAMPGLIPGHCTSGHEAALSSGLMKGTACLFFNC